MVKSAVALFGEQQQDEAAITVRVVKAHRDAVLEVLSRAASFRSADELADNIALAVLGAEDHDAVRWCVVTQLPDGTHEAYGPYLNPGAAQRAVDGGWCAHQPGTKAKFLPLIVSPKRTKRGKPPSTKKKTTTRKKTEGVS